MANDLPEDVNVKFDGIHITIGLGNKVYIGDYHSVSPSVSVSRALKDGESVMQAAKEIYRQIQPVYGMLLLGELATMERVKVEGAENVAASLLAGLYTTKQD